MGILDFIQNNFSHAFPILLAGIFAVAIGIDRLKAVLVTYPMLGSKAFIDKVSELVLSGRVAEAATLCDQYSGKPLAQVVKSALIRSHLPESMVEHGLQYSVGEATQMIQKRTSFLATIANIATLLGLFGTILGLIQSFEAVGHADPQQKSALLAAGIATSMNATMLGLAIAIPCMVLFSFITNRSNRMIAELEHSAIRVLELMKHRYYSADLSHSQQEQGAKVLPFGRAA